MKASESTRPLRAIIWVAVSSTGQAESDKLSLPGQERDARAVVAEYGWEIVDFLAVPGHSRRYIDIHEAAADMRAHNIDAFDKLLAHWKRKDFDVLVVRDGDRFARTQSLNAYVAEMTISTGARIYSLSDGWVDENNFRMWISMTGYKSASDMDKVHKLWRENMVKRVKEGRVTIPRVPYSHEIVRDPKTGRDTGIRLREELRPFFDDLADIILQGVGWQRVPHELFERGHARPDGRKWHMGFARDLMQSAVFWGHTAFNYRGAKTRNKTSYRWLWDATVPPPEYVESFKRNSVEPVYTGDLAVRLAAELTRREQLRGRSYPGNTYRFSGMVLCGECAHTMGVSSKPVYGRQGVKCTVAMSHKHNLTQCTNRLLVPHRLIQAEVNRVLDILLTGEPPEGAQPLPLPPMPKPANIDWIEPEIAQLQAKIERLIVEQASAPESVQHVYRNQVTAFSEQMDKLKQRQQREQSKASSAKQQHEQHQHGVEDLTRLGLEDFWKLPDRQINQLLKRIFPALRMVGLDKEIVGWTILSKDAPNAEDASQP